MIGGEERGTLQARNPMATEASNRMWHGEIRAELLSKDRSHGLDMDCDG
jgi:hypothetical protein